MKYTRHLKSKQSKIFLFLSLMLMSAYAIGQSSENIVVLTPSDYNGNVGRFEKLELGLKLPARISEAITDFLSNRNNNGINPFDPDQINVEATFTASSGSNSKIIHGFYYRDYIRDLKLTDAWLENPTDYTWRIRFAPNELGLWNCSIKVEVPGLDEVWEYKDCLNFLCSPSDNPGYLEIGNDQKHLRFSDSKKSFFAIGQNIAWPTELAKDWGSGRLAASTFRDHNSSVQNLADNSGNYVRIIMATWGHAIEWEQLGNYYGRLPQAWELDKIFEIAEANKVYILLCLEMHTSYLLAADKSFPLAWAWEKNPYNSNSQSNNNSYDGVNMPYDVLRSTIAKKYFKRRLRYINARWGYSTSLGVYELLNEQDGWKGFKENKAMQEESIKWHAEMYDYIKDTLNDKNHLISTSYANNPHNYRLTNIRGPSHPYDFLSLTCMHKYRSNKGSAFIRYQDFHSRKKGIINTAWKDKPSIFGELGMQASTPQTRNSLNRADPGDVEGCHDASFHNVMWATAFMGGYGVGLNWWQWDNDSYRTANFPQIEAFFDSVDFESNDFNSAQKWRDCNLNINFKNKCTAVGNHKFTREVFALRSSDRSKIIGWAHNATYYWGNLSEFSTCKDRNGLTMELPCDDDRYTAPISVYNKKIKLRGLKMFKKYNIEWYGLQEFGILTTTVKRSTIFRKLKPLYPSDKHPDLAFKVSLAVQ